MKVTAASRGRVAGVAAAVLASALGIWVALFAPVSIGGQPKVESRISYQNSVGSGTFTHEGIVRSTSPKCVAGRVVRLYGEGIGATSESDTTDAAGHYEMGTEQDGLAADYYTKVAPKEKPTVFCKAAESKHKPLN